jgi:CheY-like chemotaxis protein
MRKKQILVVEDNAIIGMDIAEHLKQMEYDVIDVVATGEEAILRANATHPDLILMDIHLDGAMDGTEAARRINARFDIPIIYITAYSDEETLASANRVFSYGYIISHLVKSS